MSSIITGPNGHDTHDGPVFPEDNWGDIDPPFEHEGGSYPDKNWTAEGQAIYNNDCQVPGLEDGDGDEDKDRCPALAAGRPGSYSRARS